MKTVFLLDVDNTLLDNDAAKAELERRILAALRPDRAARFWAIYEDVRRETGVVDFPETLRRLHLLYPELDDADAARIARLLIEASQPARAGARASG